MPCCISDTVPPILSGRRSSVMLTTAVATSRRKGKAQRTACRCAAVGEASVNGSSHSAGKEVRLVGHCVDNVTQCACQAGQAGSVTVLVLHSVTECHSGTGVKCCISEGLSATPASHTWHAWQPPGPSGPGPPAQRTCITSWCCTCITSWHAFCPLSP